MKRTMTILGILYMSMPIVMGRQSSFDDQERRTSDIAVYLDTNKSIEERVKDALSRMTLEEKVKMIHAQSKFSSAGVPRLGIPVLASPKYGLLMVLTVSVLKSYGMNGIRQDGQTIPVLPIRH